MNTTGASLSVRLPSDLNSQLERLVRATGRTKSFITVEAIKNYLGQESWQISDIQAGLNEADLGEFATEAEVAAVFAKYGH